MWFDFSTGSELHKKAGTREIYPVLHSIYSISNALQ